VAQTRLVALVTSGPADLLRKLSIRRSTVVSVENDVAELKGIGPRHAAMLKEIGVDSIKQSRHRNPARLKEKIETRHGKVVGFVREDGRGQDRGGEGDEV
jgi:hypothetical protein